MTTEQRRSRGGVASGTEPVQPESRSSRLLTPEIGLANPALLVAACAIGLAFGVAPVFGGTFSTFIVPLQHEFGWSRGALSLVFTLQAMVAALVALLLGPVIDRIGSRRVIAVSATLFAVSLVGLALTPPIYSVFTLLTVCAAVAGAGTNTFVYLGLLPQWFSARLGLIFGMTMMGVGLGQLVMPILTQYLITTAGWRIAYGVLAALVFCITVPIALFALKENPRYSRAHRLAGESALVGLTSREALKTPAFWLFGASFALLSCVVVGTVVNLVPLLIDRGISPIRAASMAGLVGLTVLFGRLAGGYLLDRLGPFVVGFVSFGCAAAAPLCLMPGLESHLVLAAPPLLGLALGVEGDLMPYVTRSFFGMRSYDIIYSRLFFCMMAGGSIGPGVFGSLYDIGDDYSPGLMLFGILAGISAVLFWIVCIFSPDSMIDRAGMTK